MRAKPHLPDTRLMPIRTASISVYACVYIDIYKEREIFMNLFFSYFVTRTINKKQTEKKQVFFGGTLPCYSEGKCLFSWK